MIYYKKAGVGIAHENLVMMEEYLNWTEDDIPNIPMFACLYQIYIYFWFLEGHTWQLGELQEPLPHHDVSPGNWSIGIFKICFKELTCFQNTWNSSLRFGDNAFCKFSHEHFHFSFSHYTHLKHSSLTEKKVIVIAKFFYLGS